MDNPLIIFFYDWLAVGFPFGILLGVLLGPARVSGVDFRQWFWDPTQPSEVYDDSWIGLMRGAAHVLAGALLLSLAVGAAYQWLWLSDACRWHNFTGILSVLADCAGYWTNWKDISAILFGLAVTQFIAEMVWVAGLKWLPALPARERALVQRAAAAVAAQPAPPPAGRRIIICCDGTWNWPQPDRETNVVRLVRAIEPEAQVEIPGAQGQPNARRRVTQIVHYHLGVGTGNILDRAVGGGAGVGLSNSVKSCYGFLVDNYMPGDEIMLFGFSRGAYVVRSVAGMIGKVGLMQKNEMTNFYSVWDWYINRSTLGVDELNRLAPHRHPPHQVVIQCIGVWDTVGALGIPGTRFCAQDYIFHDTALGPRVRHAFQALAIDEHRGNFQAAPWVPPRDAPPTQVLEQVWFPGVHSNIGGGYSNHGLSDTTLLWMVSQILKYKVLAINVGCITAGLDQTAPDWTGTLVNSRTLVWVLLGCAVPRPVGTTSSGEKLHASVFDYRQGIYRGKRRRDWIDHTDMRKFDLTDFERGHAVEHRGPPALLPQVRSKKIGICDWIMQQVGGSS